MERRKATQITKENIEEAFWQIYSETPIDKIRVSAIMQRAGYNRGTFYEYFSSVEDLLKIIENRILNDFEMEAVKVQNDNVYANSDEIIEMAMNSFRYYQKYLKVLLGPNGDSQFAEKIKIIIAVSIAHEIKKNVSCDFDKNDVTFNYLIDFVSCGVLGVLVKWLSSDDEIDDVQVHKFIKSFEDYSMHIKLPVIFYSKDKNNM